MYFLFYEFKKTLEDQENRIKQMEQKNLSIYLFVYFIVEPFNYINNVVILSYTQGAGLAGLGNSSCVLWTV